MHPNRCRFWPKRRCHGHGYIKKTRIRSGQQTSSTGPWQKRFTESQPNLATTPKCMNDETNLDSYGYLVVGEMLSNMMWAALRLITVFRFRPRAVHGLCRTSCRGRDGLGRSCREVLLTWKGWADPLQWVSLASNPELNHYTSPATGPTRTVRH